MILNQALEVEMKNRTKGQLEAEICEAVIKFEKEYMGRGPMETKAYIIDDMVLVRLTNVLTQAELKLANTVDQKDGRELIKLVRIALLEQGRALLEEAVEKIIEEPAESEPEDTVLEEPTETPKFSPAVYREDNDENDEYQVVTISKINRGLEGIVKQEGIPLKSSPTENGP